MTNLHQIKLEICDIGRRIYAKGFAAGNDGNISYRLGRSLTVDPVKCEVKGDAEANAMFTRPYRKGFEVPKIA